MKHDVTGGGAGVAGGGGGGGTGGAAATLRLWLCCRRVLMPLMAYFRFTTLFLYLVPVPLPSLADWIYRCPDVPMSSLSLINGIHSRRAFVTFDYGNQLQSHPSLLRACEYA